MKIYSESIIYTLNFVCNKNTNIFFAAFQLVLFKMNEICCTAEIEENKDDDHKR